MKTNVPRQGEGLHAYLLQVSREMVARQGEPSRERIIEELIATAEASHRTSQNIRVEVTNAVDGAIEYFRTHTPSIGEGKEKDRKLTKRDMSHYIVNYDSFVRQDNRKHWLARDDRLRQTIFDSRQEVLLPKNQLAKFSYEKLFGGKGINFLICASQRLDRATILPMRRWLSIGFNTQQFVVSNPMRSIGGDRRVANTGRELYQVIEFDKDSIRNQWKLLAFLSEFLPLAMVVFSGHKSLHGWFPIWSIGVREVRDFFRLATLIGADRMLWASCQYARMPGGWNFKYGRRQRILYWNDRVVSKQNIGVWKLQSGEIYG